MKMQSENACYVCILYIWYSIRVWFEKKYSRRSTFKIVKYFWFSWAGRKWFGIRLKQFRFFCSGSSLFFSNQSLYYRKGQQNCNFRFPTPWSRCIILTHSSLVLRYTHCNQGPKRKIHKTCMPPMKNLPKLYEWKCEKRPLPTSLI